jgi:hypothetical protein
MALFPAHAGVIPTGSFLALLTHSFPRTCGGDPIVLLSTARRIPLFPAYAGVIPLSVPLSFRLASFPRIRGGDPIHEYHRMIATALFPAYAGVIHAGSLNFRLTLSFPRIRGGDPACPGMHTLPLDFSPHTRGLQKRTTGATKNEMIFLERRTLQFYRPPRLRSRIPASNGVRA